MNHHICTESPCPIQDKECVEVLQNGFTTNYVNTLPEIIAELTAYRQEIQSPEFQSRNLNYIFTEDFLEGYIGGLSEAIKKLEQHLTLTK